MPRLIREFEARNPGVRVRSESLAWNSDEQHQFYAVNLEGGSAGLDVLMLDVIWVPEFAQAGCCSISRRFPKRRTSRRISPPRSSLRSSTDASWALPWFMNVGMLYYRKDLLARYGLRPPEPYAELVDQVKRIRSGEQNPLLDGFPGRARGTGGSGGPRRSGTRAGPPVDRRAPRGARHGLRRASGFPREPERVPVRLTPSPRVNGAAPCRCGLALFPGVFEVPWGDIAAASILASLPPILIVIGLGRFLVRGLLAGALRE
jgi:hypothetical protein